MRRNERGGRPEGRDELAQWYAEVLADQASSGLSVAEYAEEIGLTASTLYQWRRRLTGQSQGEGGRRPRVPFGLVEVEIQADEAAAAPPGGGGLIVHLGGSRRIEVPEGFDGGELRRLVTVLESC